MTNIFWDEPLLSDGDMPNKRKTIGLINYEGDVLKLLKASENEYVIYDQWDSIVDILNEDKFFSWLDGQISLTDSEGRKWSYTDTSHRDARTGLLKIFKYIR
jgi:hypothetical protein